MTNSINRKRSISEEHKLKISKALKNKIHTLESRHNMSIGTQKYWDNASFEEKAERTQKATEACISGNRISSLEVKVAAELASQNIEYVQQKRIGRYYADFYIPDINTIIEVNGCHWHACEYCGCDGSVHGKEAWEIMARDEIRTMFLQEQGYNVLFWWEHSIKDTRKFNYLVNKLKRVIESQQQKD